MWLIMGGRGAETCNEMFLLLQYRHKNTRAQSDPGDRNTSVVSSRWPETKRKSANKPNPLNYVNNIYLKGTQILFWFYIIKALCFLPGEVAVTQSQAFPLLFIKLRGFWALNS